MDYWFSPNLNFTNLSKKIKHIQTVHDLSFEIMPECFTRKMCLWHKFLNPKRQCKKATLVLVPSISTKEDVEEIYKIKKVRVLYPGLSSSFKSQILDISSDEIKQKYNLPEKYILYLGTLEPRKNILSIIEAFKINYELGINNYELVIAGSKGWKNEEILQAIESTEGVRYIGYVADEDKPGLYKYARLFVYPSLYEGFGLPVLEAMASGVPVITSNRSSMPEVVGGSAILVNPYDVGEIAKAMKKILSDRQLCDMLVERGNGQSGKFNWGKTADGLIELLNSNLN